MLQLRLFFYYFEISVLNVFALICFPQYRKAKDEKLAKRRFVGLLQSERKTPGRKRKLLGAADAPSPADSVAATSNGTHSNSSSGPEKNDVVLICEDASDGSSTPTQQLPMSADPLALPTGAGASNDDAADPTAAAAAALKTPSPQKAVRKRRVRIDDDDESPTFHPLRAGSGRGRGRGRGGRGSARGGLARSVQRCVKGVPVDASGQAVAGGAFHLVTPDRSQGGGGGDAGAAGVVFTSPDEKMFTSPPEGKVSGICVCAARAIRIRLVRVCDVGGLG